MSFTIAAIVAVLNAIVIRYMVANHKEQKKNWEEELNKERIILENVKKAHREAMAKLVSEKAVATELLIEELTSLRRTELHKKVFDGIPSVEWHDAAVRVVPSLLAAYAASNRLRRSAGDATRP